MSAPWGFFRRSRALYSAVKSATPSPKPNISAATSKKTTAAAGDSKEKKHSTKGLLKEMPVSPALGNFVGALETSRAEAVKKIWEYVKLHNLQNPLNKREIICDATLKKIFDGKDKVGILEIGKLLTPHFLKTTTT